MTKGLDEDKDQAAAESEDEDEDEDDQPCAPLTPASSVWCDLRQTPDRGPPGLHSSLLD